MKIFYIFLFPLLLINFSGQEPEINNSSNQAITASSEPSVPPSNCIASPEPVDVIQPNGTTITVVGKGNLNTSWTESIDGYTLIRNAQGNYEYANKINGELAPSGVLASNPNQRTQTEITFVANQQKSLKPKFDPLKGAVLNQVRNHLQNKTYPTTGNIRVLALLIDYPDLTQTFAKANFDSLLYGSNFRNGDGSFKYFYELSSDSTLTIDVDVMGWYRASNSYLYYGRDSGTSRAADLVREAVDAAELAGVNFANYDNNSDGRVDGILAVHAGPGAEQGSRTQYIWSHRWVLNGGSMGAVNYDGVTINDYMINPETRISGASQNLVGIGVFCHEFGHNLGLPDLYDTDDSNGDSEGIGNWGLMAGGTWLGGEHRPANFCAWSKIENGWETPTTLTIGTNGNYTLDPASTHTNEIYRINTSLNNEYFLLENRQKIGLDIELPGSGLAIWHINTNKTNLFGNSVNADENLKGVDLEEADGLNDLDNEVNRGDAGDLFPGTSNATAFNDLTNPSAMTYLTTTTALQISNIAENGNQISFTLGNAGGSSACSGSSTLTAPTGTFDDGSLPASNYSNNLNCSWLIQPIGASTVTLNFNRFAVDNIIDRVAIYDGVDFTAPLIGTYTGTTIPPTINSTGASLYMEFTTNGSATNLGWEATYSGSSGPSCTGTTNLTATSGTFNDGSGANIDYSNNLNCSWLISPSGISNIRLTFDSLDLQIGDTVYIYDGSSATANLIGAHTGNTLPPFITSSGTDLFVQFTTDGSGVDKGWQLSYQSQNGCFGSQTLTAASGTFNDGTNANQQYTNSTNCSWLIQPPGATFISLTFNRFVTENNFDFVTIYDGSTTSAPQLGRFSGVNLPPNITSSGGSLLVEFTSDGSITDFGWEASYNSTTTQCLSGRTFTSNNGSFSDGSGANNYLNNLNCSWLIQPASANSITLSFSAFDTENNVDEVKIYNGTDNSAPLVNTFSGNTIPSNTVVNGPAIFVEFITNGTTTAAGWDASYTSTSSLSCSGLTTFNATSGSFDDGSGTANYDNNLNCTWLIQPSSATSVINLTFTSMDLQIGDRVRIYDGFNTSGTLIGIRSGTNPGNPLQATSGAMFLEFTTNSTQTSGGWDANYSSSSTFCVPLTTLTANFGNFTDGSPFGQNYADNSDCAWHIQPTLANVAVNLDFFSFDTESINDTVTIYDGPNSSAPILQTLSGNIPNPSPIVSSGGDMYITFKSNGNTTASGWRAFYNTQAIPACSGTTNLTGVTGTFDDGSLAAANYVENSDCKWLIQPAGANKIFLSFNRFDTQASFDTVTVYDGATTSDPILGTFSGNSIPPSLISSSGSMLVAFKSNGFLEATGWEASYNSTSSQCFSNLTLTNYRDTLEDGSGANNYGNNLNCSWLIQPPTALSIDFDFLSLDLAANDSVFIYDGTNNSANRIGAFSGTTIPSTVSSTGGSMYVEFVTDGSITSAGWRAHYDIVSSLSCIGTTTFTAPSGSFDDGSGTGNYDNNLDCSWLIQPTGNPLTISLTVNNNNLANFGDVLRVYDGTSAAGTLIGNFFNTTTGTVTALSGSMFLVFETDANFTSQGWDVTYTSSNSYCSPNTTFTANFGNFTDGSPFGTDYVNNTDCSWLIQPVATNLAVSLRIFSIDTEIGIDTITVYDGSTTSDPILGTFSGTNIPPIVTSSGNSMLVTFKSNGSVTGEGFRASYSTQTIPFCSGQTLLTAASGTFDDGSGVGIQYVQNSNCTWLIQPPGAVSINLSFNYFNTEPTNDLVRVYNGSTTSDPLLGAFSGTALPNAINGGSSILVEFTTNNFAQAIGFEIQYTSSTTVNLNIVQDTIYVNSGIGNTAPFNITSNTNWTISENANWLLTSAINGSQSQSVNAITTQPNIGPPRSVYVYATNQTSGQKDSVLVIQRGSGNYLQSNPDTLYFGHLGGQQKFEIISNVNWNTNMVSGPATLLPTAGNGDDSVQVTLPLNNTNSILTYAAVVSSNSPNTTNDTVFIVQDSLPSQPPSLSVIPDTITINQAANSFGNFTVNSTVTWQTFSPASWLDVLNPQITQDTNTVQVQSNSINASTSDRFTYVAVEDVASSLFDTVVVRQLGGPMILSVNPTSLTLNQAANSTAIANVTSNFTWTAVSADPSWLEITPTSGTSNPNLTIRALTDNNSINPRSSYIAFSLPSGGAVDTLFVSQLGLTPNLSVNPQQITLGQTNGSAANFIVNSNLSWQTMAGANWLTVVNPTITSDTGSVQVVANSDNTTGSIRSSFVSVMDVNGIHFDTVQVNQLSTNPTLVASPDTIVLQSNQGSNANINLATNVNWTASTNASWLNVTPLSGSNSQTIFAEANADNASGTSRYAFVAFEEQAGSMKDTVIVKQEAAPMIPTTSPDTIRLGATANSSATYFVDAPSQGFQWGSASTESWLDISQTMGTGDMTVLATANSANTSQNERIAYVTTASMSLPIAIDTLVVIQEGQLAELSVSPSSINLNFASGSNDLININSNLSWTISNPATWLSVSTNSGTGNGSITITANSDNLSGSNRVASLTFSANGVPDQMVMVTQIDGSNPSFTISKDTVYVDNVQGSTATFSILANAVNWTLSENTPWMVVNPTSGNNTQLITILAAGRNIFGNQREATITASADGYPDTTITVIQRPSTPLFQVSPSLLSLGSDSLDIAEFNLSTNLISWTIEENASWMRVSPDSGAFTSRITVTATETNRTANVRSELITISAAPLVPQTILVTQDTIRAIGLEEQNLLNSVSVYPNPTNGDLNIQVSNQMDISQLQTRLFNNLGAEVEIETIKSNNGIRYQLDYLPAGFYYLSISIGDERITKKISLINK